MESFRAGRIYLSSVLIKHMASLNKLQLELKTCWFQVGPVGFVFQIWWILYWLILVQCFKHYNTILKTISRFMTCTSVKWAHVTFSVFWSYRCSLWPQVSVCIPVLRLGRHRKKVLFYCHFPDQLLTQRKSALKKLYRTPIDWLEERTTGMADMVRNITHSNMVRLQDRTDCFISFV